MGDPSRQATNLIKVRSLLLATFLLLSVLALSSPTVSRVDAAPKSVPMMVTTSITANKSYHGPNGYGSYGNGNCNYSVTDMGDPMGNVDFGVEGYWLAGVLAGGYPPPWMVDGAAAYNSGVAWGFGSQVCYGRGDSFSFNLSSIPVNAILQSASVTFTTVGASSNQGRPVFLNWSGGNMVMGYIAPLSPTLPGVDLGDFWANIPPSPPASGSSYTTPNLPVSTVQTWITNRTSGSMSVSIGAHPSWIFVTDGIALNLTYILDTTPPTTTHALSGTLGNNDYYKSAVALALAAVDTESGVASTKLNGSTYTTPLIISTEGTTTHSYYSTDVAGNVEVTKTVSVKIDTVSPATTATLTGLMGLNSWFVGPVSVSLAPTDSTSGVASITLNSSPYTAPVSFSAQGTNSITYFSTDNAGNNETTQSASFKVDTAAPQASIALECPSSGDNGWCKSPLSVKLTGSDSTSGMESLTYNYNGETKTVAGASAPFNSGVGGTSTVTLYATDKSGQRSVTQSQEIKIDGAPPTIEFRGATQTALFFRVSDGDSGVKSWALQVFNAQGQSVFYKDGTGAFDGELAWSPSLGALGGGKLFKMLPQGNQFRINLFAKDNAGHENGVQQASFTLNQIATAQPTATATPLPKIVVAVQPTKIPTMPPAIAQLPNNPTIQQPNNPPPNNPPPPSNIQPPAFVPKEEKIIIPPAAVMENPVSPILGVSSLLMLMLGIIRMAGFAANSFDERTQIVLAILVLLLTLGMGAIGAAAQEPPPATLDVPLRLQDPNTVFCGPASLGMAYDFINSQNTNSKLQSPNNQEIIRYMKENHLLYSFGTGVEELAYTARQQGYSGSFYFKDWTIDKLKEQIAAGRPILTPLQQNGYGQAVGHFVTVTGFSDDGNFVMVNDPLVGEKRIEVNRFNAAWQANGARGVVVAPSPIPTIPDSAAPLFAGVGAAAALLALAALGTARKGLGAGRTDEGEGSWADYSWREPPAQPVETWANYASYVPDPPEETWFDSRVYDEGTHEQTAPAPSSSESSQVEMTPDAGVNDAPATNAQVTQTTEPDWGAKSDAELMAQAERDAAQRRKEIKTIEDAQKLAQEEADRATAAALMNSPRDNYRDDKEKSWWEKTQDFVSNPVGTIQDTLSTAGQNDPTVKKLLVSINNFITDPGKAIQGTIIEVGQNNSVVRDIIVGAGKAWNWYDQNVNEPLYNVMETAKDILGNVRTILGALPSYLNDTVIQPLVTNMNQVVQNMLNPATSSAETSSVFQTLLASLGNITGSAVNLLNNENVSMQHIGDGEGSEDSKRATTPKTPTPTLPPAAAPVTKPVTDGKPVLNLNGGGAKQYLNIRQYLENERQRILKIPVAQRSQQDQRRLESIDKLSQSPHWNLCGELAVMYAVGGNSIDIAEGLLKFIDGVPTGPAILSDPNEGTTKEDLIAFFKAYGVDAVAKDFSYSSPEQDLLEFQKLVVQGKLITLVNLSTTEQISFSDANATNKGSGKLIKKPELSTIEKGKEITNQDNLNRYPELKELNDSRANDNVEVYWAKVNKMIAEAKGDDAKITAIKDEVGYNATYELKYNQQSIAHWVHVVSVSNANDVKSAKVTVYNSFQNRLEEYSWQDFQASWSNTQSGNGVYVNLK